MSTSPTSTSSTSPTSTPSTGPARAARGGFERGDVPGWVLVTVMTAGIVVALGGVAAPALTTMFEQAMAAVTVP